ncbi:hypothetical protein [Chryseobacterium sp. CT-SW4]|uniref:hypothetical protein n=1 Tax=Chryseobacterium sp. SW-1 TaxID=3157343 RepID=UPI003B01DB09
MKKLFNIILVLFTAVLLSSCRNDNDIPEDIHEHEEIEKVEMKLVDKNDATNEQTISIIGGVATPNLILENGKTYIVSLDFQVKHDDHYHSANAEIEEEKEEHFITYEFSGVDVNILRTADDITREDGTRIGLKTEWKVNSTPSAAKLGLKLIHTPTSVNMNVPSATNQQGSVTGGETDVNALITIE